MCCRNHVESGCPIRLWYLKYISTGFGKRTVIKGKVDIEAECSLISRSCLAQAV